MRDIKEIRNRTLRWFSGLSIEHCQATGAQLSELLKAKGIKTRIGNTCRISPCRIHQYSRGLCQTHYHQLQRIGKLTGVSWNEFVKMGWCLPTHLELRWAHESTEPDPKDPLNVLIKKSSTINT